MNLEDVKSPGKTASLFMRMIKYLRPALLIAVILALVYLINRVGPKKMLNTFSSLSPEWMAASMLLWGMNIMFATWRYRSLAAPELKYAEVLEVMMTGYLLNYVAMVQGAGVGAKIGLMKSHNVPASNSLAGAASEVILDLLFTGMIVVIFAGHVGWGHSEMEQINPMIWIVIGSAIVLCIAVMIPFAMFSDFGARMLEALRIAFSKKRLPVNIFSTIAVWMTTAAGFYCMLRAAQGVVPPLIALAAMSVGFVAGLISLVPGGLGVRDLSWAYVCTSMTGIPMAITTPAAFSYRILGIIFVAIVLGIWTLFKMILKKQKE